MRIRSLIRRYTGLKALEDHTTEHRRRIWPPAPALEEKHLRNARLLSHRAQLLGAVPRHGTCAEVGILRCDFSAEILRTTTPSRLHLIDISTDSCRIARDRFSHEIAAGTIVVHCGDSSTTLSSFSAAYFDWLYIDGDHSYDGARKDLEAARMTMKPGGMILLNDYIYFSPSDFSKYGVVEAVNEFCIRHDWEILYFALHPRMYCDVALRQCS